MSSYKNSLIFTLILVAFTGCTTDILNLKVKEEKNFRNVEIKPYELETPYIMFALEYENQGQYSKARTLYKELFNKTNNFEYLDKYVALSFHQKDYKSVTDIIDFNVLNDMKNLKQEESILRLYAFSLMKIKRVDEAIKVAKDVLSSNPTDVNHELLGSIYLDTKKYKEAYKQFEKSFELNNSGTTLITLTSVEFYYLNKKEDAKDRIKEYIEKNDYHYGLSLQLLSFYEKDKENEKIVSLLTKLYHKFKSENKHVVYIRTRDLLLRYLAKEDVQQAIDFVKENEESEDILLDLYRSANRFDEAYDLLNKLFSETNDYNYLGQIAILEFEGAEDKKTVLNSVIVKFEKTLENVSNHIFENYLAYLLIDFDKDINKGIKLVNKALKQQPNNIAYIDTLAWGEYKIKNCDKAYTLMKKVVEQAGLEDSEIKLHWEKIKECSK